MSNLIKKEVIKGVWKPLYVTQCCNKEISEDARIFNKGICPYCGAQIKNFSDFTYMRAKRNIYNVYSILGINIWANQIGSETKPSDK
jgi:hypothetical protein